MENPIETNIPGQGFSQEQGETNLGTEYGILTNPEQRRVLKERAIELAKQAKDTGMVIFMDKSARPLAHLFRRVFPIINPDTQLPDIRFLNIGTEKFFPLVKWSEQQGIKTPIVIEQVLTPDSIAKVYGEENTETVTKLLTGSETNSTRQKRLIVDDIKHSGRSLRIAVKMASVLDTEHSYQGFSFIGEDKDKKPFMGDGGLPFMPWRGITGVEDPTQEERDPFSQFGYENKKSFISAGTDNPEALRKSLLLRKDLDQLAKEIGMPTGENFEGPIRDDRFSETLSYEQKLILLNGSQSFIARAIAQTVRGMEDDDKQIIINKVHHFNSTMTLEAGPVKDFFDFVNTGTNESITAFQDGANAHYLSIMCGFIEGIRNINAGGKNNEVNTIIKQYEENVRKVLVPTPDKTKGNSAASVIELLLRGNATS